VANRYSSAEKVAELKARPPRLMERYGDDLEYEDLRNALTRRTATRL
jgi:hypothetical protein